MDEWIVGIDDITSTLEERRRRPELLPQERPYPLPDGIAKIIGAQRSATGRSKMRTAAIAVHCEATEAAVIALLAIVPA